MLPTAPPATPGPPDTTGQGWRLHRIAPDGTLTAPFLPGHPPIPRGWRHAECVHYPPARYSHTAGLRPWYDLLDHQAPSPDCACGWRVYPTLAATAGIAHMDSHTLAVLRDHPQVALTDVTYGGRIVARDPAEVPADLDPVALRQGEWPEPFDEAGCIRAEWIRITGPIYVTADLTRPVRREITRRYRPARVIRLAGPVLAAVLDEEHPFRPQEAA